MSKRLTGAWTQDCGSALARALLFALLVMGAHPETAFAQARASCRGPDQPQAVADATAAVEREPGELAPRLKLADALVDLGCYQDAVGVLEAGQKLHPHSSELSGKLRTVRSMVTEQTYIEGLTQAAESAKLQRNEIRCTRLADVMACDDALKSKPGDEQLLAARMAAIAAHPGAQSGPTSPSASPSAASSASPSVASNGLPPAASSALQSATSTASRSGSAAASTSAPSRPTSSSASSAVSASTSPRPGQSAAGSARIGETRTAQQFAANKPVAVARETLAAANELTPPETRYSNDAPAGRSN